MSDCSGGQEEAVNLYCVREEYLQDSEMCRVLVRIWNTSVLLGI